MDGTTTCNTLMRLSLLFFLILPETLSLEITRLSVPRFVPNGTEESVLLNCEYSYNPKEDQKLVLKWFHEHDPRPVYQWVPELNYKLHTEKFRVNVDYEVPSDNNRTRVFALKMHRPTTDLSGQYACSIGSMGGMDEAAEIMIIYALPSSVNLNYTIQDNVVRVSCKVEGVYPLPEMELFKVEPGEIEPIAIEEDELEYELEDGAYSADLSTNISQRELVSEGLTFFGCSVTLNGTGYEKSIKVPYFPDPIAEKQEGNDSDDAGDGTVPRAGLMVFVATLLHLLVTLM